MTRDIQDHKQSNTTKAQSSHTQAMKIGEEIPYIFKMATVTVAAAEGIQISKQ